MNLTSLTQSGKKQGKMGATQRRQLLRIIISFCRRYKHRKQQSMSRQHWDDGRFLSLGSWFCFCHHASHARFFFSKPEQSRLLHIGKSQRKPPLVQFGLFLKEVRKTTQFLPCHTMPNFLSWLCKILNSFCCLQETTSDIADINDDEQVTFRPPTFINLAPCQCIIGVSHKRG